MRPISAGDAPIRWLSTREACERLGVTLRTLYRFIDEGQLPAYKMGRVIRLQAADVTDFIERMRIPPGTLEHLYPEPRGHDRPASGRAAADVAGGGVSHDEDDGGDVDVTETSM
ncbi:MAG: helix-turn-helix domain-containing protein [Acidimicrobiales bacterium]